MERYLDWLTLRWCGAAALAVGLMLALVLLVVRFRRGHWSLPLLTIAAGLALLGIGGLAMPTSIGMWVTIAAVCLLVGLGLWLIMTGQWWAPAAWAGAGLLLAGLGGWSALRAGEALQDFWRVVRSLEVTRPSWLILLAVIPAIIFMSFRSLAGLGPVRRWLAIGLRSAILALLILALADLRVAQPNDSVTVLFLIDRSLSIPPEYDPNVPLAPGKAATDLRWERIKRFVNQAVESRGAEHKRDKAGLIVFGRHPRLELPPSDAPVFSKDSAQGYKFLDEIAGGIDANYTDIAAAIKLALASFPEGSARRIVLITDGNQNLGNAEEQARIAKHNGIEIDVVPLAAGVPNTDEVLVERIDAPTRVEKGSRIPIRIQIRSFNPAPVIGTLILRQIADGKETLLYNQRTPNPILPGANTIFIPPPDALPEGSYTYEAIFQPEGILVDAKGKLAPLAGDRVQNNRATTHVLALGQRRVLLIEAKDGEHRNLMDHLRGAGQGKFRISSVTAAELPQDRAALNVFLSNFDSIILANVPAEQVSDIQQEVIRSNTYDQGCGLIMIGGPEGFGAGGWQNTAVEKALPVDCEIKALKVLGKGGLVLLMHASEMADGNARQKEIAKLAIDKLGPVDMFGVLQYDWNGTIWWINFQTVGGNKSTLKAKVDKMIPGDMPEFDTGLNKAYDELSNVKYQLSRRHMIIISDGDPQHTDQKVLANMAAAKITVATVGVATHGGAEKKNLSDIASATGGKFYNVTNPRLLPQIYTHEARLVSQSFIHEGEFAPNLVDRVGPTQQLPPKLNPLHGFVRTTAKPAVNVFMPILGPPQGDMQFPILAYWQYGLGKSVAFTSDARSDQDRRSWDRDWAGSEMYLKFWEQVVDYSLRAVETGQLQMATEYRDGKVRIVVTARDKANQPVTGLTVVGGVSGPSSKPFELRLQPTAAGTYEAEFKADEAGSYFINIQSVRKVKNKIGDKEVNVNEAIDSIRAGVTIPYSPEFADLETNTPLLEQVRFLTGGRTYADDEDVLAKAARTGELFRAGPPGAKSTQPFWYWLVVMAAILLFFDVAVRRISLDPAEVTQAVGRYWSQLRGRAMLEVPTPQFLERLKSRKAQVGEEMERARAQTRFEGGEGVVIAPPPGAEAGPAPSPKKPAPPSVAPEKEGEKQDYASRLMKAKRKAMEDRDKK